MNTSEDFYGELYKGPYTYTYTHLSTTSHAIHIWARYVLQQWLEK